MDIGLIKPFTQFFLDSNSHFNTRVLQLFYPCGRDNGIRIHHSDHHIFHSGFDQCFSARWSSSIMVAWFQAHICCSVLSQITGISQCKNLYLRKHHRIQKVAKDQNHQWKLPQHLTVNSQTSKGSHHNWLHQIIISSK